MRVGEILCAKKISKIREIEDQSGITICIQFENEDRWHDVLHLIADDCQKCGEGSEQFTKDRHGYSVKCLNCEHEVKIPGVNYINWSLALMLWNAEH